MHTHSHDHGPRAGERVNPRPLAIALAITTTFLIVEVIGGILTQSLALLADAGHMLTDVGALALSLFAVWVARRPATPRRSFGFYRAEVLAALLNAASLIVISFSIFWEAFKRIGAPPEVQSGLMLGVAVAGLLANAASAWVLMRGGGHQHNLNTRGAFLHVVSDMLGSVGAIIAAIIMLATGWYIVDPILSALIGLLVLRGAWELLSESANILLETTPTTIDPAEVRAAVRQIDGVYDIHDMHIRTVTSGLIAMSAHVEVGGSHDWHDVLATTTAVLRDRFGIAHVTLQPEEPHPHDDAFRGCSLDTPEGHAACSVAISRTPHTRHEHEPINGA